MRSLDARKPERRLGVGDAEEIEGARGRNIAKIGRADRDGADIAGHGRAANDTAGAQGQARAQRAGGDAP